MNEQKLKLSKQSGFTLVEMAIVLVIIGLILGAVSIGKDLQRDAEYAKVKQKFVDQWASAYNAYYMRAGVVLGDDETRPQMMVNGEEFALNNGAGQPGGRASGADMRNEAVGSICNDNNQPQNYNDPVIGGLHTFFDDLGIRMPPGRAEGSEDRYVYLDSNGNPQEVQVCFGWNAPETAWGAGNMMIIAGLTPDLARALDQMIDGKPDSREGMFRRYGVDDGTGGEPGIEWAETNRDRFGTAAGDDSNLDENQVITVVAFYKMNQ